MTAKKTTQIKSIYNDTEQHFHITTNFEKLSGLTQFSPNDELPIHRWFHFKEGFSATLLDALEINNKILENEEAIFVDPFSGSGTTILAGDIQYHWKAKRIGFEINPFLAFVSSTKSSWMKYDIKSFRQLVSDVLSKPLRKDLPLTAFPKLSSFRNPKMFSRGKVSQLVDAVSRVKKIDSIERDLMLLGIAAAVEKVGFYRKDGRALRILRDERELKRRKYLRVESVLRQIWHDYEEDILLLSAQSKKTKSQFRIFCADGRTLLPSGEILKCDSVNLMVYSPPYLNHIDYTEVYKMETWLLGFVESAEQMTGLRKNTFRSHGSYYFEANGKTLPDEVCTVINLLSDEIEKAGTSWHKRFRHVAFGYFEDMLNSLKRQYELLAPGCTSICVVANSAHGSKQHRVPVATDLLIAVLAQVVGFKVSKVIVARRMSRRDTLNTYLRESVIVMEKPPK